MKGFDIAAEVTHVLPALVDVGYEFVGRYGATHSDFKSKILSVSEAQNITSSGIKLVSIWENGFPDKADYFSEASGAADGVAAAQFFQSRRQPQGTPIYFAVDYDASAADLGGPINAYFAALDHALAPSGYLVGVYGSGLTCQATGCVYTWLAQSMGWAGSRLYTQWNIKQGAQQIVAGLTADTDVGQGDIGAWAYPGVLT